MSRQQSPTRSLAPVPPELLDRAAAKVCRLPEGVSGRDRNRAILELLLDEGATAPEIIGTCLSIDARLDALCNIAQSPRLKVWLHAGGERLGFEILSAAAEAPLHATRDGYVFDEERFFAIVLDAAVAQGVA
jgi:hypothetical protein